MTVVQIICNILLVLSSVVLIVAVLISPSKSAGLSGALSGQVAETFLGKNKARTLEGKLKKVIRLAALVVFVCALAIVIILRYVPAA